MATPNMQVSTAAKRARLRRREGLVRGPVGQRTERGARREFSLRREKDFESQWREEVEDWEVVEPMNSCLERARSCRSLVRDSGTMRRRKRKKRAWHAKAK